MTDRPTFEETYPRYEFAELVRLGLATGRTVHRFVERERTMGTFRKTATIAAVTVLVASAIMPVLADDGATHAKFAQPVGSQPMELSPTSRGDRSVVVLNAAEMDKVAAGTVYLPFGFEAISPAAERTGFIERKLSMTRVFTSDH